jgi:hypothetical protein
MKEKSKKDSQLWKEFEGVSNSNEILLKKAKGLTPFLILFSNRITDEIFDNLKKLQKKNTELKYDTHKGNEVFVEVLFFLLHCIDRISFQYLGIEKRAFFMDMLFIELREEISKAQPGGIESIKSRYFLNQTYNERQKEYSKYKEMFPEKDKGFVNTLFWEFGKKIAKTLGAEMDIFLIITPQMLVVNFFKVIDLPFLLTGVKTKTSYSVESYCSDCGARVKKGANFCTQCGRKITL